MDRARAAAAKVPNTPARFSNSHPVIPRADSRAIFFAAAMITIAPARVGSNDVFLPRAEDMAARRVHVGAKSVRTNRAEIRAGLVGRETPTWAVNAPRFHILFSVRACLIPTVLDIDPKAYPVRSGSP